MKKGAFALLLAIIFLLILLLSWAITSGIIYLICLCFHLNFSLKIATGVWLVLLLISGFFRQPKNS